MTITSLLVSLQLGQANDALLSVASGLAARYKAHVEGIALSQPIHISASDAYLVSDLAVEDREARLKQMAEAEQAFRAAMASRAPSVAWHADIVLTNLAAAVAAHARAHDLIVAPTYTARPFTDPVPPVHLGDLIMQAGRPVLIVPPQAKTLALDHVLVAWKDGAPARRAAGDSLPLLKAARRVTLAEIVPAERQAEAQERLAAVSTWLARHGVTAEAKSFATAGEDSDRLAALAQDLGADLVVAGAYAHNRVQEWMFGGVTRSLLSHKERCILLSH
ncbi:MAG TPA: universal stress protein [Acidisoma sp.]|nr:universal stress protein [Acidisoma sp.]